MKFVELEAGDTVGSNGYSDPTVSMSDIAPLGEWFARPIKIFHWEWDEETPFATRFIPIWKDYFTTPIIRRKLEGFSRMRADLKVKILVNGSPFRYGELMMSYRPLYSIQGAGDNTLMPYFSGGMIAGDIISEPGGYPDQDFAQVANDKSTLMARSQRPNLRIQPHINSGGIMTIPFVYFKDALEITQVDGERFAQRLRELGTLTVENLVTLKSTAEANSTGVSITMYVWAENVDLWGPTSVTAQGIDEFEETLEPSAAASTVAEAAGTLSTIPVIRPYALATQFLAGVAASSLKYFGWSNPPVLTAVPGRMPKASFLNPGPCSSFPDDVLALDPKNELTVDPRTVGANPQDPLIIADFAARSAIVDIVEWKVTDTPGTLLAQFPIQPCYYHIETRQRTAPNLSSYRVTATPATYIAGMFEYWRGTMVVKFRTVASQFHRGRIAVTWDPAAYSANVTFKEGAVVTHIIDLASASDMTVKIPFMSHYGMCRTQKFPFEIDDDIDAALRPWSNRTNLFTWTPNQLYDHANGLLEVRVLNHLQCGDATADVRIIVEVAFEDMTVMCPTVDTVNNPSFQSSRTSSFSRMALTDFTSQIVEESVLPQGLEAPGVTEDSQTISAGASSDDVSRLYGGECVPSLRSLLHRTYPYRVASDNGTSGAAMSIHTVVVPRFPVPMHTRVNGFNDRLPTSATSDNSNLVATSPISLITACFTGYRGSFVWKAVSDASTMIWMHRYDPEFSSTILDTGVSPSTDQVQAAYLGALNSNNGASWNRDALSGTTGAVFPQYNNYRMMPGNPITHYRKPSDTLVLEQFDNDGVKVVNARGENMITGLRGRAMIALSVAAGTDFNVFHFVNVPDIYLLKTPSA